MNDYLIEIKKNIENGDLETAIKLMLKLSEKYQSCSRYHNEIIGHKANLNRIVTNERKEIINPDTLQIQRHKLMYALLDLTDILEQELNNQDDTITKRSPLTPLEKGGNHITLEKGGNYAKEINFNYPVNQVIIQQTDSGDIIQEKTMKKEKVIEISGNAQISAPVVIADSIQNSFNTLAEAPINDDLKTLLEQLLNTINEINKQVPTEKAEIAENMAQDAETLVKEASKAKPRRKWYEMSIEGLKEAAKAIGELANPIFNLINKIAELLPS